MMNIKYLAACCKRFFRILCAKRNKLLASAIIITGGLCFLAGCSETLAPDDVILSVDDGEGGGNGNDGDGEESNLIVDGGLALYNMPGGIFDMDEGAFMTPETFGRRPSESDGGDVPLDEDIRKRGKYLIDGPVVSTSKLDSGGFTDVQFIHYKEPLTGEFTVRARVLMTAKAGDSSSKGFFFGAFTGTPKLKAGTEEVDHVEFAAAEKGAGLLFRTNDTADGNSGGPAIRPYFKDASSAAGGWSTGPTRTSDAGSARPEYWLNARQPAYKQERILEVTRQQANRAATDGSTREVAFIFRIYDSKSGAKLNEAFLDTASVNEGVRLGQPVYVGIALLGSSVEFSEIGIWDNKDKTGEPFFKTPETEPAYVVVESVKIGVRRGAGSLITSYATSSLLPNCGRYAVSTLQDAVERPITLETVYTPSYADNLFVDWEIIIDNSDGGITLERLEGSEETGWKKANITVSRSGSVVIMAVSRDSGLADHCVELVVNE
ncbi:MAG: hypothetical protein LBF60_03425 [Treponema sp.]|nr:hypothetical protein [Treponema sp.]